MSYYWSSYVCVSGGKKCSFFGKFGVLCFLETLDLYPSKHRRSHQRCSITKGVLKNSAKKVFLEISQNSQETTCVRVSFLINLQACNFI